MFQTLFTKITLALLTLFVVLGGLLVIQINSTAEVFQKETSQKLHLDLANNIVNDSTLWREGDIDPQSIEDAFHMMMVLGPDMELYVVSPEGDLLNYSDPEGKVIRERVALEPIRRFLVDNSVLPILGDDPRSLNAQKIFSVAPIFDTNLSLGVAEVQQPRAYLYIIIGGENYDSVVGMLRSSRIASTGTSILVAGIAFLLSVILLLFFFLTRPIKNLSTAMTDFRNSNFTRVPENLVSDTGMAKDELQALSGIFHEMATRVVCQFEQMKKNRNLRQEFITHISHDLRTPLASVKGYLDSWQINQETQSQEEAQRCIEIALKNCVLLEHMVEELFELSRLEANEISPDLEEFQLDELIDDIAQKLNIKAMEKNVRIVCQSLERLPFVIADVSHINRVVTNLLDNALRHSKDNSEILVELSKVPEEQAVQVRISDKGNGIPVEMLSRLFEPYFRASNQEQNYTQGTGLGLAIAKRLLSLQNSTIRVESKEGEGSVFSFSLTSVEDQKGQT